MVPLNKAFVDPRKPDVYQLRQCVYWRPSGFNRSSFGEQCRSGEWLPNNPFKFKNFCVNCNELKRNGTPRPSGSYTPNFAIGQYIKSFSTFNQVLECDTVDKSVSFTPSVFAKGYTLYASKITDGLIGPGTYGPLSKSDTECARLEVSFSAAVNENIKVVLLYQMLGRIKFDRFNVVLVL